tara:strand:+ start:166 stop:717 length:552 start_codon:yes stop_codon:yes gene_type:complete
MKKIYFLTKVLFTLLLGSCSKDNKTPEVVNEEELITTLTATLVPEAGGTPIILTTRDLDGDGPNEPIITVSSNLAVGVNYNGSIVLLDETKSPADIITEEVEEEAEEHQFFYTIGSSLDVTATSTNFDSDGNVLGTEFLLIPNSASNGLLTFTLRHEPTKPNDGLSSAGGETDIEATFTIIIE